MKEFVESLSNVQLEQMRVNESIKKAAADALEEISQYGREKFTHGTGRIRLYYSDVDGDWLDEFQESNSESLNLVQEYKSGR